VSTMNADLRDALGSLCARGRRFDRVMRVLKTHRRAANPILVRLLSHSDPAWRAAAASAFARMRATPPRALPHLLRMLKSPDARAQVAAIAAMDFLPKRTQAKAVPAVARLLESRPPRGPSFTSMRAHLPRAVSAHFLGRYGGARGRAALAAAARNRRDPVLHHIQAALRDARPMDERAP
jgi:HEAT repeats